MFDGRSKMGVATCVALLGIFIPAMSGAESIGDPTAPPRVAPIRIAAETSPKVPLDLSAIIIADERRVAIINGQRVREMDRIGSTRVLRIRPGGVDVERDGEAVEIKLIHRDVKGMRQ